MTDQTGKTWDVFVSFAGPDEARAKTLMDLLGEQGLEVFCSNHSLGPGHRWSECIPKALEGSKVVAVLLSEHSGEARYQRDEIHRAITLEKQSQVEVVPVYLDGFPARSVDWDFGLGGYTRLDWRDGPQKVAESLARRLDDREHEVVADDDCRGRHTYGEIFYKASLRVDRSAQWAEVLEICAGDRSALFLLHGPKRQNHDLFIARIWHYLSQECSHHHRPYLVPLQDQYSKPRSAAGWEIHLGVGLGGGSGTAEDLLREAARKDPVFLVMGRYSIGAKDLDETEQAALEEFLEERLPRLIRSASAGRHSIRAIVSAHSDDDGGRLVDALDARGMAGFRRHELLYRKLPPLKALEWEDLEYFLGKLEPPPLQPVYAKLREAFEQLDHGNLEFRQVIELLERVLYL